jgi:hypothetical protein
MVLGYGIIILGLPLLWIGVTIAMPLYAAIGEIRIATAANDDILEGFEITLAVATIASIICCQTLLANAFGKAPWGNPIVPV